MWRDREHLVALPLERQPTDERSIQTRHEVDVTGVPRGLSDTHDLGHVDAGVTQDLEGAGVHHVRCRSALRSRSALHHHATSTSVGD
jgi:hypothetical protein